MKKIPIRYAVVRFQPYPETGEFANIGVIAIDPEKGLFDYKLAERHSKRVTDFFHNLDRSFYRNTVKQIKFELDARLKAVATYKTKATDVFDDLVKPKSNLFQFNQLGVIKANSLHQATEELYSHFVGHEFARDKGYEAKLRERVKHQLDQLKLKRPFIAYDIVGPGGIKARFDLVRVNERAERIIKPFAFNGSDASKLSDHTFNELKKFDIAKESANIGTRDILIPTDVIADTDAMSAAWAYLKPKLASYGDLVPASDTQVIEEFARH